MLIVALTIGTAAAFGLFIVILGLALGSAERELTLARLTVMGHDRPVGLALAETMPAVLAAVIAGAVCAVALPHLVGSSVDLSAFTGTGAPVEFSPDALALGLPAAAIFVLALATLLAQTSGAAPPRRRRPAPGTLGGKEVTHMATTPLQQGSSPRESLADLGAESARQHRDFGAGSLIVCDRLVRIYVAAGIEVQALQGLDLLVAESEIVALVGASGSGKSTLMNILAGLDTPTAGSVRVAGQDLAAMTSRQRLAYRRRTVGFIWQQTSRNLLPYLTAQQNVELPMRLAGSRAPSRRARAAELLDLLGLGDGAGRRPDQMSGGEQQRAAIAVALVNEPKVLLADEPTGELDTATAAEVFGALQTANRELGVTVLIVTHDPAVSSVVRRVVAIRDGRTSTEIHRLASTDDDGEVGQHAVEYAVLDRAGRLQLPKEMTEPLGMRDLVRLEGEPDHIGVWPDRRDKS